MRACPAAENCVRFMTVFTANSQAQGVLILLLPQGQDGVPNSAEREQQAIFLLLRRNDTDRMILERSGVAVGNYDVLGFDVAEDGTIFSDSPAVMDTVAVARGLRTGIACELLGL